MNNNRELATDINNLVYPPADKQYPSNLKYETYEELQTGAQGKAAK
jgi:hypothetical protein